jgi:glycosyltransferase involved in cell wall biosynthesis
MAESLPKITVITVTFNLIKDGREAVFRQCVESVHNQTYPNIEHLVMDGASTDGTLDLIREYEEKEWLKCYSEPDSGHWNAMNKGIKKATGKYILFLNSDDYFVDKNGLSLCIAELEKNDENCYGVANFKVVNKDGKLLTKNTDNCSPAPKELFYRLQTYNHETLICPKRIYEKLNFHNEKYKTAIDYEFNIKLILNGYKQIYVDTCLTAMRTGGSTTSLDGKASKATIDNVLLLFKDLYPWADFKREDIDNMYHKGLMKRKFINNVYQKIEKLNLKNIDYNILKADIEQFTCKVVMKYYLFGINICEQKAYRKNNTWYLLKCIPLLRIKIKKNTRRIYLFGFIPLLKIKSK